MRRYFNYFTIDAFSTMLFGSSLNCLERNSDIVNAKTSGGNVHQVPFIQSLLHATQINTVLGMEAGLLPLTRKFFSWHPYKKAGPVNLPFGKLLAECSVMMNAGTETTTAALTNAVYLIYTHPSVLEQLREELDPVIVQNTVPSYDAID
ncbi:cytochrome P450 oxidoreductase [Colletotrichum filicis]|nr:cytochrome P450 oxidoreductase [Colletotrichum filicis]